MSRKNTHLSRRTFLKGAGALTVAAGSAAALSSCEQDTTIDAQVAPTTPPLPVPVQYPAVPYPPVEPLEAGVLQVFTPHEARTVEALTARILPGTPDDPGAREAGVVYYIDNFLAFNEGFPEPTYRQPPYAEIVQSGSGTGGSQDQEQQPPMPTPPTDFTGGPLQEEQAAVGAGAFQVIPVPAGQIERYGYQSILTPRDVYRIGIEAVDRFANEQFGQDFVALSEDQQDQIIDALANGQATGFRQFSGEQFFHVVRRHTAEGMFSDPAYGGNRGMVGWYLIGYPGAQRAYTPVDVITEGTPLEPQSMFELHPFNPGQHSHSGVVLPLSGSDPNTWENARDVRAPVHDPALEEQAERP